MRKTTPRRHFEDVPSILAAIWRGIAICDGFHCPVWHQESATPPPTGTLVKLQFFADFAILLETTGCFWTYGIYEVWNLPTATPKNILKYVFAFGNARGTAPAKLRRDLKGLRPFRRPLLSGTVFTTSVCQDDGAVHDASLTVQCCATYVPCHCLSGICCSLCIILTYL